MKFVDANLLLLSYDTNATLHKPASHWFAEVLSGSEPVGLPMLAVAAFIRISTDRRLPRIPLRMADALEAVGMWLTLPHVSLVHTSDRTWELTQECIVSGRVTGAMVSDAQLAALTIEHGAILYTNDSDFARFPGLRWANPLVQRR